MAEPKLLTPGRLEVLRDQSTLLESEQEELWSHIDALQARVEMEKSIAAEREGERDSLFAKCRELRKELQQLREATK